MCIIIICWGNCLHFNIHFHVMLGRCVDEFTHPACSDFKEKHWCSRPTIRKHCCETCGQEEAKEEEDIAGNNIIRLSHQLD